MTELSDELLVAYVDGQLARDQTRAVEKVLKQDDVIARRVAALREAHGRLEAAFEAILASEVSEVTAEAGLAATPDTRLRQSEPNRSGLAKAGLATAGIVVALLVAAAGYGWPLVVPELGFLRSRPAPVQPAEVAAPSWQSDAARAQSLLGRASLEVSLESQANRDLIAFQLAEAIGPDMKLPDLAPQGFSFVRAQLLQYQRKPLAQMLYLPATGDPVALYARAGEGETPPVFKTEAGIGTVSWSDDGIAYLLAGRQDEAVLLRLAEKIRHEPKSPEPKVPEPNVPSMPTASIPVAPAPVAPSPAEAVTPSTGEAAAPVAPSAPDETSPREAPAPTGPN